MVFKSRALTAISTAFHSNRKKEKEQDIKEDVIRPSLRPARLSFLQAAIAVSS
jgi:hypothetical protein